MSVAYGQIVREETHHCENSQLCLQVVKITDEQIAQSRPLCYVSGAELGAEHELPLPSFGGRMRANVLGSS
jgi:hypothetical protein